MAMIAAHASTMPQLGPSMEQPKRRQNFSGFGYVVSRFHLQTAAQDTFCIVGDKCWTRMQQPQDTYSHLQRAQREGDFDWPGTQLTKNCGGVRCCARCLWAGREGAFVWRASTQNRVRRCEPQFFPSMRSPDPVSIPNHPLTSNVRF